VIQTLGGEGLRFKASDTPSGKWHLLPAFKVPQVRDTAGAGDWCTAGLLYALHSARMSTELSTLAVATALRFGQALAALNCMHSGARGLAKDEARERLKELASFFCSHEHVEWSATREWSDLCRSARQTEETKQGAGWQQDEPRRSTRLCCEFLPV
jgi:fructokinase